MFRAVGTEDQKYLPTADIDKYQYDFCFRFLTGPNTAKCPHWAGISWKTREIETNTMLHDFMRISMTPGTKN